MNIFAYLYRRLFGGPAKKPEPKNEPPKFGGDFPRPVSVTMKATQTVKQDPMAAAIARSRADAKKTAVKGNVSSARSSSTQRPFESLLDPTHPLHPFNGLQDDDKHHVLYQGATTISDTTHRHVASHSEPVSSHSSHSGSHSSHDSGSYDSGSSHHNSGSD